MTGCSAPVEEIDVAKEEEAIKALIKKELALWADQDYIPESELVKKADYVRMITNFGNNHKQTVGWDSITASLKESSEQDWSDLSDYKMNFKDFNVKVYDKVAWAVYYTQNTGVWKGEPFDYSQTRVTILEKADDNWKMVLNSITGLNPCETKDEDEEADEEDDD
jgi:hypothetical protein